MQEQLLVGVGQIAINPPFGAEMSGFIAREGKSEGVHDPIWAKALVISDRQEKFALVIADLVGIDAEIIETVRLQTARITDITPDRVIVGATHTHSGPAVLSHGYLGLVDPTYQANLVQNLAGAVYLANQNLEPVDFWVGEGDCCTVGKNRRKPGGSTDPQLLVLRFEGAAGTKALVVNYACHPF
jgi:neutral ceramidase